MNTRRILGLALVVVAIGVAIVLHSSVGSAAKPGDVNEARVLSDAATGNNWLLNGRTFDAGHFSPLQQITDKNIGGLGLAWFLDIDGAMGVVSEPIVVDGVIYLSAPLSKVYAVDAATGKLLWKFDPPGSFGSGHQRFLFRARQRRRRSLEWQGVRRHGRLPLGCHRCRNGTKRVGSNGL